MNVGQEKAETGLAGRYANAVFELAQEKKSVDVISVNLAALKKAIDASPDLARLVKSPLFSRDEQARALKPILEKLGLSPLAVQFLLLLVSKRRLNALGDITTAYETRVAQARGETQADVTAARALSDSELGDIKSVLKSALGREPRLATHTDPTLLGGLVVKVGSRMIDSSLRTKLQSLRAAMKGT